MLGPGKIHELHRRVIDLECELAELRTRLADWPHTRVRFADRPMVVKAIRAVSEAKGQADTADALRHLGNCAYSWANQLDVAPGADRRASAMMDGALKRAA